MGKKTAVLIRDKNRQYEGLRCSLGLLLEDHAVSMIVLNHEIVMTNEYRDNMMYIDDMGGYRYSNVPANIKKHGFISITLSKISDIIRENEVVIPF